MLGHRHCSTTSLMLRIKFYYMWIVNSSNSYFNIHYFQNNNDKNVTFMFFFNLKLLCQVQSLQSLKCFKCHFKNGLFTAFSECDDFSVLLAVYWSWYYCSKTPGITSNWCDRNQLWKSKMHTTDIQEHLSLWSKSKVIISSLTIKSGSLHIMLYKIACLKCHSNHGTRMHFTLGTLCSSTF